MKIAPKPADEAKRLEVLRSLEVLDTDPTPEFDRVTELLCEMLDVPMALVSLIDDTRQFFKAAKGFDAREAPRDLAFCSHAILESEMMVVPDTHDDQRFFDHPYVTEDPRIRFYAGVPLEFAGANLGTLCALDTKPRSLSDRDKQVLEKLTAVVVDELRLRQANALLKEQSETLRERNEDLDMFVRTLSHDLVGPISRVGSFLDLLEQRNPAVDDDDQKLRGHLRQSSSEALELIHALKTFYTLPASASRTLAPACASVTAAADSLQEELRGVGAEVSIQGSFPKLPLPAELQTLLFRNLLSNAIKYRSEHRALRIRVRAHREANEEVLTIEDNGLGIEPPHTEKVFDALYRLHSKTDIAGSGLGLAICRRIVTRAGGRLWVESDGKSGSRFLLAFPSV